MNKNVTAILLLVLVIFLGVNESNMTGFGGKEKKPADTKDLGGDEACEALSNEDSATTLNCGENKFIAAKSSDFSSIKDLFAGCNSKKAKELRTTMEAEVKGELQTKLDNAGDCPSKCPIKRPSEPQISTCYFCRLMSTMERLMTFGKRRMFVVASTTVECIENPYFDKPEQTETPRGGTEGAKTSGLVYKPTYGTSYSGASR